MDKYGLWAGHAYYPEPGVNDYKGRYPDIESASIAGKKWVESRGVAGMDWWRVVDLELMEEVATSHP